MKITLSRFAATAIVLAVLTMAATGRANAQDNKCSHSITACGCTISLAGKYQVPIDIFGFQGLTLKSGCIDINVSNVKLTVNGAIVGPSVNSCPNPPSPLTRGARQPISKEDRESAMRKVLPRYPDDGSGPNLIGVHVLPGISNVTLNFGGEDVCGWTYGVESEGANVSISTMGTYDNNVGLLLNNATANSCLFCDAEFNFTGVQISGGSGNSYTDGSGDNNLQYGFWVYGSSGNKFTNNFANYNFIAGFYLGCAADGEYARSITCPTPTTGNTLVQNTAGDNGDLPYTPGFGIAVERKSLYNVVQNNTTQDSAFNMYNETLDIVDGNGNCVYNTYKNNNYQTKQPRCIH